jgi:hypothetical protein
MLFFWTSVIPVDLSNDTTLSLHAKYVDVGSARRVHRSCVGRMTSNGVKLQYQLYEVLQDLQRIHV